MALFPDFDTFARGYNAGENKVVYARLAADMDTPVSLGHRLGRSNWRHAAGIVYSMIVCVSF